MPEGLQIFNDNGSIRDNISTHFSRPLVKIPIPEINADWHYNNSEPYPTGSVVVSGHPAGSTLFHFFVRNTKPVVFTPDVVISGDNVSWSWPFSNSEVGRSILAEYNRSNIAGNNNLGGFFIQIGFY